MKGFLGGGGEWGCIVTILARATEESWFRVVAGFKFFLQTVQMNWGPPSFLLGGCGKLSGQKLKLTTHLIQLLHSPYTFIE